jgi:hypothetical protein
MDAKILSPFLSVKITLPIQNLNVDSIKNVEKILSIRSEPQILVQKVPGAPCRRKYDLIYPLKSRYLYKV